MVGYLENDDKSRVKWPTGQALEDLEKDIKRFIEYIHHDEKVIYSKIEMLCTQCGMEGDCATILGHMKENYKCCWHNVFWAEETTIQALMRQFEDTVINSTVIVDPNVPVTV